MAGETVLIVEDRRENIVHLANNVLRPSGYNVITAMDGQRGLDRILSDKPDLVILDLNMPKMDGLEVLSALRERRVKTPVILATFYGSEQVAQQALSLGAVDYLVKPYKVTDVLQAVEKALTRRTPAPAATKTKEPEELDGSIPLTRQMERWWRDMNILTRVGKTLVAQLDVRRVCTRTVEAAMYITRANHAFLLLLDEDVEARLCLCATRGPQDREVRLIKEPVESRLALQVARTGQTLIQPDAEGEVALAKAIGHPLGPLVAVPLRWQQEIVGVLVATRDPGESSFGDGDVEWLGGLADYAAIAVRNARSFEHLWQSPASPGVDAQRTETARQELEQLAIELQAAAERVQRLSSLLAGDDAAQAEPGTTYERG